MFALADIVISRAGQMPSASCWLFGSLTFSFLSLPSKPRRSDFKCRSFERQGFSMVLEEKNLRKKSLVSAVHELYENRGTFIDAMRNSDQQDSIDTIISLIEEAAAGK